MIKKLITLVLSLILMSLVILGIGFYFFKQTVTNPQTYHDTLRKIEAGNQVQVEVENALIDLMLVNNMPTDWVRDLVSVEFVQQRMHENINEVSAALSQQDFISNDSAVDLIVVDFGQRIEDFLQSENKYLDKSDLENLEIVKTEMKKIIENETLVLNPTFLSQSGTVTKISSLIQKILILPIIQFLSVGVIGLGVLFQILFFKNWTTGLRYTGMGIMAGSLFWFILGLSAKLSGFYEYPMIQEGYLKDLVACLGEFFMTQLIILGLMGVAFAILLTIPYLISSYRKYINIS